MPRIVSAPASANIRKANFLADVNFGRSLQSLIAIIVQVGGEWSTMPCGNCTRGEGDWAGCVVAPSGEGHLTAYACANCVRRGLEDTCSLRLRDLNEQAQRLLSSGEWFLGWMRRDG